MSTSAAPSAGGRTTGALHTLPPTGHTSAGTTTAYTLPSTGYTSGTTDNPGHTGDTVNTGFTGNTTGNTSTTGDTGGTGESRNTAGSSAAAGAGAVAGGALGMVAGGPVGAAAGGAAGAAAGHSAHHQSLVQLSCSTLVDLEGLCAQGGHRSHHVFTRAWCIRYRFTTGVSGACVLNGRRCFTQEAMFACIACTAYHAALGNALASCASDLPCAPLLFFLKNIGVLYCLVHIFWHSLRSWMTLVQGKYVPHTTLH